MEQSGRGVAGSKIPSFSPSFMDQTSRRRSRNLGGGVKGKAATNTPLSGQIIQVAFACLPSACAPHMLHVPCRQAGTGNGRAVGRCRVFLSIRLVPHDRKQILRAWPGMERISRNLVRSPFMSPCREERPLLDYSGQG